MKSTFVTMQMPPPALSIQQRRAALGGLGGDDTAVAADVPPVASQASWGALIAGLGVWALVGFIAGRATG